MLSLRASLSQNTKRQGAVRAKVADYLARATALKSQLGSPQSSPLPSVRSPGSLQRQATAAARLAPTDTNSAPGVHSTPPPVAVPLHLTDGSAQPDPTARVATGRSADSELGAAVGSAARVLRTGRIEGYQQGSRVPSTQGGSPKTAPRSLTVLAQFDPVAQDDAPNSVGDGLKDVPTPVDTSDGSLGPLTSLTGG